MQANPRKTSNTAHTTQEAGMAEKIKVNAGRALGALIALALALSALVASPATAAPIRTGNVKIDVTVPAGYDTKDLHINLVGDDEGWLYLVQPEQIKKLSDTSFEYIGVPEGDGYFFDIWGNGLNETFSGNVTNLDDVVTFSVTKSKTTSKKITATASSSPDDTGTAKIKVDMPTETTSKYLSVSLYELVTEECIDGYFDADFNLICTEYTPVEYYTRAEYTSYKQKGSTFTFYGVTPNAQYVAVLNGPGMDELYTGNTTEFTDAQTFSVKPGKTTTSHLTPKLKGYGTVRVPIYTDNPQGFYDVALYQLSADKKTRKFIQYGAASMSGDAVILRGVVPNKTYILEVATDIEPTTDVAKFTYYGGARTWKKAKTFKVSKNKLTSLSPIKIGKATSPSVINRNLTAPKISGTNKVGKTLTATPGTWDAQHAKVSYKWLADGKVISGANKSTLKVTAKLLGKSIKVRVTSRHPGFVSGTAESKSTPKIGKGKLTVLRSATITGKLKVGATVKAVAPKLSAKKATKKYQWYVDGKRAIGATKSTFKLPASAAGKTVRVKITASKAGYKTLEVTAKTAGKVAKR